MNIIGPTYRNLKTSSCFSCTKISDKIRTEDLLVGLNMSSINQLNAKIKLTEMWKTFNILDYPTKVDMPVFNKNKTITRTVPNGKILELGMSTSTFISDGLEPGTRHLKA